MFALVGIFSQLSTSYVLGLQDLIRRLGIEPLILPDSDAQGGLENEEIQQRAVVSSPWSCSQGGNISTYSIRILVFSASLAVCVRWLTWTMPSCACGILAFPLSGLNEFLVTICR